MVEWKRDWREVAWMGWVDRGLGVWERGVVVLDLGMLVDILEGSVGVLFLLFVLLN